MIVLVAGTGTEVGKTWVTAATATVLGQRGCTVRAYKPVQSFAPGDEVTDAHVLGAATGQRPDEVCPPTRWLPIPMAPPMAAEALGLSPFTIADLVRELGPDDADVVFVESAGGVRSPLAVDGDTVAFARACAPGCVVLVADAGLGTINAVRLAHETLGTVVNRVIVHLNHFDAGDDLHQRNHEWLTHRDGFEVVTDPETLADALTVTR